MNKGILDRLLFFVPADSFLRSDRFGSFVAAAVALFLVSQGVENPDELASKVLGSIGDAVGTAEGLLTQLAVVLGAIGLARKGQSGRKF